MKLKRGISLLLAILCVIALVSCSPSDSSNQTTTTTQGYTQPAQTGATVSGISVINNIDYTLYIPSSYRAGEEIPLLMALHGGGQGTMGDAGENRNFFADYTGLNKCAEKYGFIIVYPRQSTKNHSYGYDYWNWYIQQAKDAREPKALHDIVSEVKKNYTIDDANVYICGLSAGAAMAQIVAVNYPSTFAGCCSVAGIPFKAGSIYEVNEIQNSGPTIDNEHLAIRIYDAMGTGRKISKMLVVTGTADTRVHPRNSLATAQTWAMVMKNIDKSVDDTLKEETLTGIDGVEYKKSIHAEMGGEEICTLYEVIGMEHNWPGSNKGISISISNGKDLGYTGGINLNEVMCEFFGLNK
ncbi:MAG: PHB depolymerase family esterase [Clostridia bacterium]|nr:PHB depolymerase family esterase [Clostridia bacterium]